jgi:hypothetical protein
MAELAAVSRVIGWTTARQFGTGCLKPASAKAWGLYGTDHTWNGNEWLRASRYSFPGLRVRQLRSIRQLKIERPTP